MAQQPQQFITLVGEGSKEERVFLYYQNEFQDQVHLPLVPDSVTGRWTPRRVATTHPLWLQLAYNSDQYGVYVQPGDTIYIRVNAAHAPHYSFRSPSGQASRQAELNFFNTLLPRGLAMALPDYMGLFVNARYPRQAELFCRKFDQRQAWLQQQDSLHLSPRFVRYASQQLERAAHSTLCVAG